MSKYSPFKMKGHTLPGIKQSPAKQKQFVMGQETGPISKTKKDEKYTIMDAEHMGKNPPWEHKDTLVVPPSIKTQKSEETEMLKDESYDVSKVSKGKYKIDE